MQFQVSRLVCQNESILISMPILVSSSTGYGNPEAHSKCSIALDFCPIILTNIKDVPLAGKFNRQCGPIFNLISVYCLGSSSSMQSGFNQMSLILIL
jgi:hypothetical protein